MALREEHKDLFTVGEEYHLAHCIASDLLMGGGIAVPMQKQFNLREKIRSSGESTVSPTCILVDRVFNLITKRASWGKPTYDTLELALVKMREIVLDKGIKKIAMPRIGCGLDRLHWWKVSILIEKVFGGTDVEILVCRWE